MRYGFTTGSCAAAAAKAAAYMLLSGREKTSITIETPKGIPYTAALREICRNEQWVSCGVEKDGGDDPDITTGALICAKVSYGPCRESDGPGKIRIDGGVGVGRVTKPGLDQPVGNAAINRVPREMIQREVREVCSLLDYTGDLTVEIFVPTGEALAGQTFNPRLGIVNGISILGTSGIVEPMSQQAIVDTIRVELNQRRAEGFDDVAVSPGNYGLAFLQKMYGYDLNRSVKCSNFIGETIDLAVELGFRRLLLTGHVGKLIKVAGGIMNTHSREADCRMELLCAFALRSGVSPELARRVLDCVTTEDGVQLLSESGKLPEIMDYAVERICNYLERRSGGKLEVDCIIYTNALGVLGKSKGAEQWFTLLAQEQAPSI
ncbi:MAG: cobalt-precorrin-5B (C(1))-methyltransferase CbiD [Oscillospiraceae bacterium]|nr:cobalt-precorrin-5B (C(1))-methyltransferase CbiD [Oscillospiraceae bacterium]